MDQHTTYFEPPKGGAFRAALSYLFDTEPPEYVQPNGENLHEYADKLQSWCLDMLGEASIEWATGMSIIEAVQVIVAGSIENANIPVPDSWQKQFDTIQLLQEQVRMLSGEDGDEGSNQSNREAWIIDWLAIMLLQRPKGQSYSMARGMHAAMWTVKK